MKKSWWIVLVIVLLLIIVWALPGNKGRQVSSGPYKIGVIAPLTGDAAAYGEPLVNVLRLAVKEVNDSSGAGGNQLELIVEDGKCNGKDGASAAQKLVNVDKVEIIIGGFCSSESLAAIPVAEAAGVALLSGGSSSPDLTGKSPIFFRNYPSDSNQGKILAEVAYSKGLRNLYLLVEQTDYAKGIAKVLGNTFTGLGGKVTAEEFPSSATDLRQQVTKARGANPDALVFSVQTPAIAHKILRALQDLKWQPKLYVNDVIPGDPETLSTFKSILEGAITAEFGTDPANPIFKRVLESYKLTYGAEMPFQSYGQTMWDAVFIVADGIKTVGYNGEKFAQWGRTIKNWQGAAGLVTIGHDGDPSVGHRAEIIKGGKVEVLK